nr:YkgJ family cysteine cluster protein [Bermanella sp. WJH001]
MLTVTVSDPVNIIETKDITPAAITADNKCDFCSALCCSYITQELDTPRTMHAFDVLLWQVAHKGIHVFKDGNGWYLLSMTKCEFVMPDNRCGIYETRPMICRDHSNSACEFDVPIDEGCDLYFQTFEKLDNYCRKRFKTWDKRLEKFEEEQAKAKQKKK